MVSSYGLRHDLDFDKYEALRLAEQLESISRATSHEKDSFYDFAVTSLQQRLSVPNSQFKAYFLVLLVGKDYALVLESISKVDKSLARDNGASSSRRSSPYVRPSTTPRTNSRVVCCYCGVPGHRVAQCWRKQRDLDPAKFSCSQESKSSSACSNKPR